MRERGYQQLLVGVCAQRPHPLDGVPHVRHVPRLNAARVSKRGLDDCVHSVNSEW